MDSATRTDLAHRFVEAITRGAEALETIAAALHRAFPDGTGGAPCDECGADFEPGDLYLTQWGTNLCTSCWIDVTNGAPLPGRIGVVD